MLALLSGIRANPDVAVWRWLFFALVLGYAPFHQSWAAGVAGATVLETLEPWQWVSIPDTRLIDNLPPESFSQPIHGIVGPSAIVGAWSGGAFDGKRNRLMVTGGGHADYCGNEWLAFDLDDLHWVLLSGPSSLEGYDDSSGMTPDGAPASRHTYNGLVYIPSTDELLMHGGSLCNGAGSADNRWWVGNPADGSWTYQGGKGTWLLGYTTAYDAKTGLVFESRRGPLYSYDPNEDVWHRRSNHGDTGKSGMTGAIDPARGKFVLLGQGAMYVFDLKSYERTLIEVPDNYGAIVAQAPGLEYVKSLDRYVAWSGGDQIFLIHPESWAVRQVKTTGDVPGPAAPRGTYGRFRYSEKYNGFVLVNSVDSNVLFLKAPPSIAPPPESDNPPSSGQAPVEEPGFGGAVAEQREAEKWAQYGVTRNAGQLPPVRFGNVWCPDSVNSARRFQLVQSYRDLPNDPVGDGKNNCYMEAFDTSIFATDGKPLRSCANLRKSAFPGHACREVSTREEFKSLSRYRKLVAIITDDIEVPRTYEPYLAAKQESLVVIGTYDPITRRPVLISSGSPAPSTFFNWNVDTDGSRLYLINLRMHGNLCVQVSDRGDQVEFMALSITAKCAARFIMAAWENDTETRPVNNRVYLKRVLARSKNSHTIYLDRTYLNWIEDSLIMGPWLRGKHAAKYTGQNVVVRNSLHSNQGVHGRPVVDPEYYDPARPWLGKGGLAPISMASCNRAVLDGVTVVNHVVRGNSNPQAIQWQFRDALGAGCDLPRIYRFVNGSGPAKPYYGPTWYEGVLEKNPSAWKRDFWRSPRMLDSYVINSRVIQTYGKENPGHGGYYALMSDGTYPSVRDGPMDADREPAERIPDGWIERQRIHVSGNCLDNGVAPDSLYSNHVLRGMGSSGKHRYDNTDKFVAYGTNSCSSKEPVAEEVVQKVRSYLGSLPAPPWQDWQ